MKGGVVSSGGLSSGAIGLNFAESLSASSDQKNNLGYGIGRVIRCIINRCFVRGRIRGHLRGAKDVALRRSTSLDKSITEQDFASPSSVIEYPEAIAVEGLAKILAPISDSLKSDPTPENLRRELNSIIFEDSDPELKRKFERLEPEIAGLSADDIKAIARGLQDSRNSTNNGTMPSTGGDKIVKTVSAVFAGVIFVGLIIAAAVELLKTAGPYNRYRPRLRRVEISDERRGVVGADR